MTRLIRRAVWQDGLRFREVLAVEAGIALSAFGPPIEIAEFHVKHGGLQGVETRIFAGPLMNILRDTSVNAQCPELFRDRFVIRSEHPSVAERAEIFCRKKPEAADFAHRAGAA